MTVNDKFIVFASFGGKFLFEGSYAECLAYAGTVTEPIDIWSTKDDSYSIDRVVYHKGFEDKQ